MYVYIHDPFSNAFNEFVAAMGWTLAPTLKEAQIVVFTGGSDVDPQLYGEPKHHTTSVSPLRDGIDIDMYNYCQDNDLFMVGICRGGQFLNVMNGGKMIQDVEGHAVRGTHPTYIVDNGGEIIPQYKYNTTSTHHQMMIPSDEGIIYAAAQGIGGNFALQMPKTANNQAVSWTRTNDVVNILGTSLEPECVAYPDSSALCFQPHPEYDPEGDTTKLFKECWERFLEEHESY